MSESIIVARPEGRPQQLMLLFHGVGANAQDLVPLGHVLAAEFPEAFIVSIAAPLPSDLGAGRQWFSVQGHQRGQPRRARGGRAAGLRRDRGALAARRRRRHRRGGAGRLSRRAASWRWNPRATGRPWPGRVVSIAGRFARLPETPNEATTLHMFHGKADPVIPTASPWRRRSTWWRSAPTSPPTCSPASATRSTPRSPNCSSNACAGTCPSALGRRR
jgi:phospholipase/carboxylesterase